MPQATVPASSEGFVGRRPEYVPGRRPTYLGMKFPSCHSGLGTRRRVNLRLPGSSIPSLCWESSAWQPWCTMCDGEGQLFEDGAPKAATRDRGLEQDKRRKESFTPNMLSLCCEYQLPRLRGESQGFALLFIKEFPSSQPAESTRCLINALTED